MIRWMAIAALCVLPGCADDSVTSAENLPLAIHEDDWPCWRGPGGNNVAVGPPAPVSWSSTKNVIWKAEIPGRGHSSPTVVGKRVFLATADKERQTQSVVAFDRKTGAKAWTTDVNQGGLPRNLHRKNSHATCTLASDGERLFVAFYNHQSIQVTALDLDGKRLWQRVAGPFRPRQYKYGYAPSPTLYKSLVIIAADYDGGGYLVAMDRRTGKQVWRISRAAKLSYSSPIVAHVAEKDQLLISGCDRVTAYDPNDGKEIWSCPATTMATCGTMVWQDDLVFASGGYPKSHTVCIRADGSGKIVWQNSQKCYEQSMLAHDGFIYAVNDTGIAYCWKADDGKQMWRSRLRGPVSASPVLSAGNIYLSNEQGTTFVFKANPNKFELVSKNQLGDEAFSTPTICGGRIYLRVAQSKGGRRQETLYCIGAGG